MPKAKRRLRALHFDEVAFCEKGMNPRADIVLYKSRAPRVAAAGDLLVDDSIEARELVVAKFQGSPRNRYGTHASSGFRGNYGRAWRIHFSRIGGGALTGNAGGPIRGTVRRVEMIGAAMKPPCNLPGTESVGARSGGKSPLPGEFPEKPSDYGLSRWDSPENPEDAQLTCADLALIKRAALAEIKWRASQREEKGTRKGVAAELLEDLVAKISDAVAAEDADLGAVVLDAFDEFAALDAEIPLGLGAEVAKQVETWASEGRVPDDEVRRIVKSELDAAGLLEPPREGGTMEILKSLSERVKKALTYVLGGADPAEFFKGTPDGPMKLIVGLVEKAADWGDKLGGLEVELAKAKKDGPAPATFEAIVKSVTDPTARAFLEQEHAANLKLGKDIATLQKATRRKELVAVAKSLDCLPNENDALVEILVKADDGGFLDKLEPILISANRQAAVGKAYEDIGVETDVGTGGASTPKEAFDALVAKSLEIRKSRTDITAEKAFELACEQNPDLYRATRGQGSAAH